MKLSRFQRALLLLAIAPVLAGNAKGCSNQGTSLAQTNCMAHYVDKGLVNQTNVVYFQNLCAAQVQ